MTEGIAQGTEWCPNPGCRANLGDLLAGTLPAGTLLRDGSIRIDYPLGRGGFGITYRATHLILKIPVAVKEYFLKDICYRDDTTGNVRVSLPDAESFDTGLRKFLREGRTLAQLDLRGIVRIYDLFSERNTAYLVMEYLEGPTLKTLMTASVPQPDGNVRHRTQPLAPQQIRRVMDAVVHSVAALHAQRPNPVYHLDIKPGNIILTPSGRVVLIDFGAARQGLGPTLQNHSLMAYTPGYAPPELQARNPSYGPESDIFELGMVLYEMLTGELPPSVDYRASQPWQPSRAPEPYQKKIAAALVLDRSRRPKDVYAWWFGRPRRLTAQKASPAIIFGALTIATLGALAYFLFGPERPVSHKLPAAAPLSSINDQATPRPTPSPEVLAVMACPESGQLATRLCPNPTRVLPSFIRQPGLCDLHAKECPECHRVWSRKEGNRERVLCPAEIHSSMPPRQAQEITRLTTAEPLPPLTPGTEGAGSENPAFTNEVPPTGGSASPLP